MSSESAELPSLPLIDTFGRVHSNLRISLTDRCNLRCLYCMPEGTVHFQPKSAILSYEEITRVVRIAISLGVTKVRLTGGEPLVRQDVPQLVQQLANLDGLDDIGLTTNGLLLEPIAQELWDAGLRRLNISLDALDAERFEELTRRKGYEKVLEGIEAARRVGFKPIKLNAVAMRGLTDDQVVPFGELARESGLEVRFIEYMPLDASQSWEREKVLFASEIRQLLEEGIMPLRALPSPPHAPATEYEFVDGQGRIGFIPSVSEPFCGNCDRFRLTADGKIRNCLFSLEEFDIKTLLRDNAEDTVIAEVMRKAVSEKWAGHHINAADFEQPDRPMYSIGG
ncbi:GTP 3',8-cyclase MoaA [Calycomorphotria hydatis]|uniref:GTP 3',8-cyclase n=1 Tax=Calycomorphotria hydatis TaxID=2528027 RepID=A0A517T529_9PLAN|nr:GTP 3',8-cyclase MoaA [Calycomorphotria hydatis]QDT63486.1 Cyclic pyranopterin monophosphate synthase [Calycomorphotria hydatis]